MSGTLPSKDQLLMRRVVVLRDCPVCNKYDENVLHTLVTCRFARLCYNKIGVLAKGDQWDSFTQWLDMVFQNHSKEELNRICMTCWSI